MDNLSGLRDSLLSLKGGVSPGTGGMRNKYLTCLAEVWEGADMMLLEQFGMRYLTGHWTAPSRVVQGVLPLCLCSRIQEPYDQ